MRKLLGRAPSDTAADVSSGSGPERGGTGIGMGSVPRISPSRPVASQDVAYNAGRPISCLEASPDGRTAVLASRHMIRTIRIDGTTVHDGVDVTAVINGHTTGAAAANKPTTSNSLIADQLSIRDVKWYGNSGILTACASGKMFYYDLAHLQPGIPVRYAGRQEDGRQVNSLAINPHRSTHILAGTMDGIVRYLDLRVFPNEKAPFNSFRCNEGISQVKWSPSDGMIFAACTEMGSIFKWDIRQGLLLRIHAHEKACTSMAWHPDGQHLISGGLDQLCYVWDMSEHADKRQKAKYTIRTAGPVSDVCWRPGIWSATAQTHRVAQVAVTYDDRDPMPRGWPGVQIWDLSRPTVPYKTIDRFSKLPSALLWRDRDVLWTAGGDNYFHQCDVAFAPRPIDSVPYVTLALSSTGDVAAFLDERPPAPVRPRTKVTPPNDQLSAALNEHWHGRHPTSMPIPILDFSLADSEDEVVRNFLGLRLSNVGIDHPINRPADRTAMSWAQPSLDLDTTLARTGRFKVQQGLVAGQLPGTYRPHIYHYLSACYLETMARDLPRSTGGKSLPDRLASILEQYARVAETVGLFRLAQTWRVISYGMSLLLRRRARYHRDSRLGLLNHRVQSARSHSSARWAHKYGSPSGGDIRLDYPLVGRETRGRSPRKWSPRSVPAHEKPEGSPTPFGPFGTQGDVEDRQGRPGSEGDGRPSRSDSLALPPVPFAVLEPATARSRRYSIPPPITVVSEEDVRDDDAGPGVVDVPSATFQEDVSVSETGVSHAEAVSRGPDDGFNARQELGSIDEALSTDLPVGVPPNQDASHRGDDNGGDDADDDEVGSGGGGGKTSRPPPAALTLRLDVVEAMRHSLRPIGSQDSSLDGSWGERGALVPHRGDLDLSPSPNRFRVIRPRQRRIRVFPPDPPDPPDPFTVSQTTDTTDSTARASSQQPPLLEPELMSVRRGSASSPTGSEATQMMMAADRMRSSGRSAITIYNDNNHQITSNHLQASTDSTMLELTEEDYLPWPDDPPYPFSAAPDEPKWQPIGPSPIGTDPYKIIRRVVAFESRTSALNTSAIVLLLRPLVPGDVIDPLHAAAILRQHHSRLMKMRMSVEAALLRNLCVPGQLCVPGPLAGLPNRSVGYPAVFGQAQHDVKVAFACPSCHRAHDRHPADRDEAAWTCRRCRAKMGHCAVCGHREAVVPADPHRKPFSPSPPPPQLPPPPLLPGLHPPAVAAAADMAPLSTWWYCPGCKHGGHASCLHTWHALEPQPDVDDCATDDETEHDPPPQPYSGGRCPYDGCGHVCVFSGHSCGCDVAADDDSQSTAASCDGDGGWPYSSGSRAAELARESAAAVGTGTVASTGSQPGAMLGGSPGWAEREWERERERERERRRSVKFAASERRGPLA